MKEKYELLAPAGNFAMLSAAVNAGADAVYFGLQKGFGMRVNARNFAIKDLDKMREICEASPRKVKMYLTLNTIVYDNELKNLEKIVRAVKGKVDAIICWDLAVIELCKKYGMNFFISTQASVSNAEAVKFYKKLGAKRIVFARELSLNQIKKLSKLIYAECFVHGAMCVAVSGRCFTSQFLYNRSANRGACIHPCRRSYSVKDSEGNELAVRNNKIFSAKDLCMLPFVEKMKAAGIRSFKIEGRNRDPRYVDVVTRIYRKALDKKLNSKELEESLKELEKVYNKEFSSGFYLKTPGINDFASMEHSAATEKKKYVGKITHYYSKLSVATIKLVDKLKIGDKLAIIGNTTGIENFEIKEIEMKNKKISFGNKGDEVGIKIPRVRKNDEVYRIIKNKK